MTNSNQKGKVGEREFSKLLRESSIEARRGVQYSGGTDSPDIVSELSGVHFEVKYAGKLNIYDAVNQAAEDAGDKLPVVAYRQVSAKHRGKEWLVIMKANDAIELLRDRK